jgi:putative membrane protein
LIGLALSIFLGFRNNASYDRFWEGRKLWGQVVNETRSLARQVLLLVVPEDGGPARSAAENAATHPFQREVVLRIVAYAHALRHHLRNSDPREDLAAFLPAEELTMLGDQKNVPLALLQTIGQRLQWAWRRGWVHDLHLPVLERSLTELTAIQGGCERIKSTPLPFAYTVLIHRLVASYCLLLPFGIVDQVGLMTPVVVLLIAHAFLGLDDLGDEIEEPFGTDPNDLPLAALSRTIEINLRQLAGERDVPAFLKPVRNVLS